jgi:hypothetical protein
MSNYRQYGFKGMIRKPFDFKTLSEVVDEVLKNQGPGVRKGMRREGREGTRREA